MLTHTSSSAILVGRVGQQLRLNDQLARVHADTVIGRIMAAGLTVSEPLPPDLAA